MPHSLDENRLAEIIEGIMEHPDFDRKLTAWEMQFMESVSDFYRMHGSLSDKQKEVLERIHCKL